MGKDRGKKQRKEGANIVITMQQACKPKRIKLAIRTECYSSDYKCESCLTTKARFIKH